MIDDIKPKSEDDSDDGRTDPDRDGRLKARHNPEDQVNCNERDEHHSPFACESDELLPTQCDLQISDDFHGSTSYSVFGLTNFNAELSVAYYYTYVKFCCVA